MDKRLPDEEKHQNEFMLLQNELAEAEKQLKVFEEGVYKITTIYDAEHYQTILKETLSHVQVRKELCAHTLFYPQPRNANANVLYARGINHVFDCAHQQVAQFQTSHVFGSVGLLPMSYQKQPATDFTTLVQRNEFQLQEHLNGYVGSSSTATSKISLAKVTTTAKRGDDEHSSSQTLFPIINELIAVDETTTQYDDISVIIRYGYYGDYQIVSEHFKAVESELSVCGDHQSARQSSTGDIAIWVLGEA
ncbi:hypothetical protein QJS10_CPA02g00350 [Acorus calamus]|uniref:Uncharacterized protein n=1 Tax=Acorus calamus TaxID=4465 RepID=A0AAV9F9M0_ACOCL|nr:hypothetical protein QJS10_CPA02g00350 [Acorus calamus]